MPGLTKEQRRVLLRHGFIWYEVRRIDRDLIKRPAVFDLTKIPWQLALKRRAEFWLKELQRHLNKGLSKAEARRAVIAKFLRFYTVAEGRSPWDFVKREYHPPKKLKDFKAAAESRELEPARVRAKAESTRADKLARDRQARVNPYARAKMRE